MQSHPAKPVDDLQRHRLLKLARPLCCTSREEATGRCLALSLELALLAHQQLGLDLQLVRWHVSQDPDYVEHWAVELSPSEVIDPTSLQVGSHAKTVAAIDSYPANFTSLRRYPASLLLDLYETSGNVQGERLPARFLAACALRILGHDLRLAGQLRSMGRAAAAVGQAWNFALVFTLNSLSRRLEERAGRLIQRLHPQAEVSARARPLKAATAPPMSAPTRTAQPPSRRAPTPRT